jgi:hypothetical protein
MTLIAAQLIATLGLLLAHFFVVVRNQVTQAR